MAVMLLISVSSPVSAQVSTTPPSTDDAAQPSGGCDGASAFADYLLENSEYYRSVTEYHRVLFSLSPDEENCRLHAITGIAAAYYRGGEFERCSSWLAGNLAGMEKLDGYGPAVDIYLSALLRGGEEERAREMAEAADYEGSCFYGGLASAYSGDWEGARMALEKVSPGSVFSRQSRYNAGICRKASMEKRKNPRLAGYLGLIPGAGYLYAGHRRSAATSFVFNSALILSAVQAFRNDNYALGGTLSLFSFVWYSGNVYGSVHAARRYNYSIDSRYLDSLILER